MANPFRFGTFTRRVTVRGFRLLNSFGVLPPLPGFAWRNEKKLWRQIELDEAILQGGEVGIRVLTEASLEHPRLA